jgi:hypothetical protein
MDTLGRDINEMMRKAQISLAKKKKMPLKQSSSEIAVIFIQI